LTACRFNEAFYRETAREAGYTGTIGCQMNRLVNNNRKGFTIIELMIVLMIIAILVALAYPSFIDYLRKAKRAEAQEQLLSWAIKQETWRSNNPSYNNITPCTADNSIMPCNDENYQFDVVADGTSYTLEATAIGDQANDSARNGDRCTPLTLNENNGKTPLVCWK
jgi:type IV pilus assembly protein PilE